MNIDFTIEYNKKIPAIKLIGDSYRNHWIKSARKNNKHQKIFDFTDFNGWCKILESNDKNNWFLFMKINEEEYSSFANKNESKFLIFSDFKLIEKKIKP
ncbi:MAG: hypothetical protein AM1032_000375 [Mycoplasmataceae bacterium]|nr:MAG: hypothetical protein AM1032_000375 [Mycoplasmataceae bacterium]